MTFPPAGVDVPCQADPELMFVIDPQGVADAKAVCFTCPWVTPCRDTVMALEAATPLQYRFGVCGGLDPQERYNLTPGTPGQQQCGTPHGARRHRERGATPCENCREAERHYKRERRAAKRPSEAVA